MYLERESNMLYFTTVYIGNVIFILLFSSFLFFFLFGSVFHSSFCCSYRKWPICWMNKFFFLNANHKVFFMAVKWNFLTRWNNLCFFSSSPFSSVYRFSTIFFFISCVLLVYFSRRCHLAVLTKERKKCWVFGLLQADNELPYLIVKNLIISLHICTHKKKLQIKCKWRQNTSEQQRHTTNKYFIPFTSRPNMPLLHTSTLPHSYSYIVQMQSYSLVRLFHVCVCVFVSDFIRSFAHQLIFLGGFKIIIHSLRMIKLFSN